MRHHTRDLSWLPSDKSDKKLQRGNEKERPQLDVARFLGFITLGIYSHAIGGSQRRAPEKVAGIVDYNGL
jgi:hypothetical protein